MVDWESQHSIATVFGAHWTLVRGIGYWFWVSGAFATSSSRYLFLLQHFAGTLSFVINFIFLGWKKPRVGEIWGHYLFFPSLCQILLLPYSLYLSLSLSHIHDPYPVFNGSIRDRDALAAVPHMYSTLLHNTSSARAAAARAQSTLATRMLGLG